MNLKELQAMASQRGIVGRSKMNKSQLEAAIAKHDAPVELPTATAVLATLADEVIAGIFAALGKPQRRKFRKQLAAQGLKRQAALAAA